MVSVKYIALYTLRYDSGTIVFLNMYITLVLARYSQGGCPDAGIMHLGAVDKPHLAGNRRCPRSWYSVKSHIPHENISISRLSRPKIGKYIS